MVTLAACTEPDFIVDRERSSLSASQTQAVKRAFSSRLKDPLSAQYTDMRIEQLTYSGGTKVNVICGKVNAKNSFGGYTGFKLFAGRQQGDGFTIYAYPALQCAI